MQDGKIEPKTQEERAEWVRPVLTRLSAGSAELAQGTIDDGQDFS
ncbi:MAG: hypothetical protein WBR13_05890 [Allosphingosinicella sp.]